MKERSSSTAIGISNNAPRPLALPIGLMKSHRKIRGSSRRGAHKTLRGVLESWARQAGWTLVWNSARDYAVGSSPEQAYSAVFRGGFLEVVDQLLAGDTTRRTLSALAYKANRHLVIEDAGAAGPVPARPAIVAVKTTDAPLIAALRDAGIQAGQAAVLTVDADRRIVRLDWSAPNEIRIGKTGKEGS